VLVGLGGEVTLAIPPLVAREVEIVGSFRFDTEFAMAADLVSRRRVDPGPLVTHTLPMGRAVEAFDLASDRAQAMKVQLDLASPG
jgi:L-idonate 5-dehydrogenase